MTSPEACNSSLVLQSTLRRECGWHFCIHSGPNCSTPLPSSLPLCSPSVLTEVQWLAKPDQIIFSTQPPKWKQQTQFWGPSKKCVCEKGCVWECHTEALLFLGGGLGALSWMSGLQSVGGLGRAHQSINRSAGRSIDFLLF